MRALTAWLLAGITLAAGAAPASPAPEAVIRSTFDASVAALIEHRDAIDGDAERARALIDETLGPRVHFELMSRLVLGRAWREADEAQRKRFMDAFRAHVTRTYARVLADNVDRAVAVIHARDELLEIQRATEPDDRGRVIVYTTLTFEGRSLPVHYRLVDSGSDGWLIYDVAVENISFVTNYRQEFGSIIRRDGIDALIRRLEERAIDTPQPSG